MYYRCRIASIAVLIAMAAAACGQAPPSKPLTPEQKEKLKERDRLEKEWVELERAEKFSEAIVVGSKELAIEREVLGNLHRDTIGSVLNLAWLKKKIGQYSEAETLYTEALAGRRKTLGDTHLDTLQCINKLAVLYQDRGRYAEAEPLYKEALAARRKVLGSVHADT